MTHSKEKPLAIERHGLSIYVYNHDIKEVNTDDGIMYEYEQYIFNQKPDYNKIVNRLIQEYFPDGEEMAIQRKGIVDSTNSEFVAYNLFVEEIKLKVKENLCEI